MPTLTSNFGFSKPLVNNATDADLWGGQLNTNWDDTDGFLSLNVQTKTADFSIVAADFNSVFSIDASSGGVTATLPAASSVFDGFVIYFKATDTTNTITIDGNGSETIDGSTSITLTASIAVVCDGSNWITINTGQESTETQAGIVEKATQAEAEAETSNKNITADNFKYNKGAAKALVNFSGTGGTVTIRSSYNVSSVTRNGAGDYTVNFTSPMATADYFVAISVASDNNPATSANAIYSPLVNNYTTTSFDIKTPNGAGNGVDMFIVSAIVMGDLA